MKWYNYDGDEVIRKLGTNREGGLTAADVQTRQASYGKNEYEKKKETSLFKAVLYQLKDVSTIVLICAALLSLVLALHEDGGFVEPVVIAGIIVLNISLAISQERSAERSLEALEKLNSPTCLVLRDGSQQLVDTCEVVPGDLLILSTGSLVPADARIVECVQFSTDESALTGESEGSEKHTDAIAQDDLPLGDQKNMVFSGCLVLTGHAVAVVTDTGMQTQMGKIAAHLSDTTKRKTPLQTRLDTVGKLVSGIAVASAVVLFALGLAGGEDLWHSLLLAASLAVAAVPETMSLIVTLSMTNGVKNMVERQSLTRKLTAVETLGNTSVICSDKTGTLTQNQMTVRRLFAPGEGVTKADELFGSAQTALLEAFALASQASEERQSDGSTIIVGDPTESAILRLLTQKGGSKAGLEERYPLAAEIPFSSERKMMTCIRKRPDGGYLVLSKGALDRLPVRTLPPELAGEVNEVHDQFAGRALRVLALAAKTIDELPEDIAQAEQDLTLMGLIGLIDPPRPEAIESIAVAKQAGIRTIMITGDHADTAQAIAQDMGILEEGDKVMTGAQLSRLSDRQLTDQIRDYSVYARVSPDDKIRIVRAWQAQDEVVAMTGDGVNDAPALKAADVGVAMGMNGTEVAKSAADIVLTDDNFSTIVHAVEEGRNVYLNIQRTIYFLLVCNFSEIIVMLVAYLCGWGILATPIILLLVNVLGDGIPGLALAKEPGNSTTMKKKPVKRNSSFFGNGVLRAVVRQTIACSGVVLVGFYVGAFVNLSGSIPASVGVGQTTAFLVLGITSILHIFNVRSRESLFSMPYSRNPQMVKSACAMLVLFVVFVAVPQLRYLFGFEKLDALHWLLAIVLSIIPSIVNELAKKIARKHESNDAEINDFV